MFIPFDTYFVNCYICVHVHRIYRYYTVKQDIAFNQLTNRFKLHLHDRLLSYRKSEFC